jgi:hypothetical protein
MATLIKHDQTGPSTYSPFGNDPATSGQGKRGHLLGVVSRRKVIFFNTFAMFCKLGMEAVHNDLTEFTREAFM